MLVEAARLNRADMVHHLCANGADPNERDRLGELALNIASAGGCVAATRALLERGSAVNAVDMYGVGALHKSAAFGHTGVASLLLDHGASVDKTTEEPTAPSNYEAISLHSPPLVLAAMSQWAVPEPSDRVAMLELLLTAGADPGRQDLSGRSAADAAAEACDASALWLLARASAPLPSPPPPLTRSLGCTVAWLAYSSAAVLPERLATHKPVRSKDQG